METTNLDDAHKLLADMKAQLAALDLHREGLMETMNKYEADIAEYEKALKEK